MFRPSPGYARLMRQRAKLRDERDDLEKRADRAYELLVKMEADDPRWEGMYQEWSGLLRDRTAIERVLVS